MRTALPASVAAAAACLLLAGCGAGPRPAATPTEEPDNPGGPASDPLFTAPADDPTEIPSTDPASPEPEVTTRSIPIPTPDGGGDGGAVDPAEYTTEDGMLTHLDFDSPDRNLHCGIWDTGDENSYYGCTIERRTYREPPRGDCQQAFGKGFVAPFAGRPRAACRGDVLFLGETQRVPVLPSGASVSYGAVDCSVDGNAVTCGNQRGDGFTLSAKRYSLRG